MLDVLETFSDNCLGNFINGLYSVAFIHKNQRRQGS